MVKLKENSELIKILNDAGIVTKEYANPASAGTPAEFIISTIPGGRGILVKNSDMAKLEVATDKEHRQAVLTVKEGKRKITRNVTVLSGIGYNKWGEDTVIGALKNKFPIRIPGAKLTCSDYKTERVVISKDIAGNESWRWKYTGKVTATVNRSRKNTFLLGMDETSHFISVLPKEVKSVKAAHSLLRPRGVPQGAKRQGEFFFIPVDEKRALRAIRDKVEERNSVPLEEGSNHRAQYAIINTEKNQGWSAPKDYGKHKPLYVKGLIFDKRAYRHAPVDLGNVWHRVVRNKESLAKVPKGTRQARRYD